MIGNDVTIGPFCIVGSHVRIGDGCNLIANVYIAGETTIAANTTVYPFAVLGLAPQSLAHKGELTKLEIGANCTIREGVTMNAGTVGGGGITRVGDRGYFMNNAHIGHDCIVGNDVIFASSATLGGHSEVGDHVFIGGLSAVHQRTRIGHQVMVAGVTGVRSDIIPYGFVVGSIGWLDGLNVVGMQRRQFTRTRLQKVRQFYRQLFYGPGLFADRLRELKQQPFDEPAIGEIIAFVEASSDRSLCLPRAQRGQTTR